MEGWIKLHRKLIHNAIFSKPEYFTVWIYLLLSASHSERNFIWNNQNQKILPGQLITGRKKIAQETGVREGTVERILNYLENEQQIEQQKTSKYRIITIINWYAYQKNEQQNEQQIDNRLTTELQQIDTYNNIKNGDNGDNVLKRRLKDFLSDSAEFGLAVYLYEQIQKNGYKVPKPNLQVWAKAIDLMIRIDKRTPDEIRRVIDWAMADTFWFKNILSTEKLRKQFARLLIEMEKKNVTTKQQDSYYEKG